MSLYSNHEWQSGSRLTFLVILPIAIALWYALVRTGVFAQHFPLPLALAYWLCLLVPRWWLQDLATRLLHRGLQRWRPPRLLLLVLGGVLGIAIFQPYGLWLISWFQETFAQYIPPAARYDIAAGWAALSRGFAGTVPQHLVALTLWIVANLLYDRATDSARFGYPAAATEPAASPSAAGAAMTTTTEDGTPAATSPATTGADLARATPEPAINPAAVTAAPAFASRLRRLTHDQIIAIEAEDHYVRVHSQTQSELIHYRFTDAVAELQHVPGMRVHRSYWVARLAIRSVRRAGPNLSLVLVNGAQIPIGRSYNEAVRQVGLAG